MKRMFRVHTPAKIQSYNDDKRALTLFLNCPLDGGRAILECLGDAIAVRYDDKTVKVFGAFGKTTIFQMVKETNYEIVVDGGGKGEDGKMVYFVRISLPWKSMTP